MIPVVGSLVAVVLLVLVVVVLGMRSMNRRESSLPADRRKKMAEQAEVAGELSCDDFATREPRVHHFSPDLSPIDEPVEKPAPRPRPPGGRPGPRGKRGVDEFGGADDYDDGYWTRVRADEGGFGGTIAARKGASRPLSEEEAKSAADSGERTTQMPAPAASRASGLADLVEPVTPAPVSAAAMASEQRTVTFSAPTPEAGEAPNRLPSRPQPSAGSPRRAPAGTPRRGSNGATRRTPPAPRSEPRTPSRPDPAAPRTPARPEPRTSSRPDPLTGPRTPSRQDPRTPSRPDPLTAPRAAAHDPLTSPRGAAHDPLTGPRPTVTNDPLAGPRDPLMDSRANGHDPLTGPRPAVRPDPLTGPRPVISSDPLTGPRPTVTNDPLSGGSYPAAQTRGAGSFSVDPLGSGARPAAAHSGARPAASSGQFPAAPAATTSFATTPYGGSDPLSSPVSEQQPGYGGWPATADILDDPGPSTSPWQAPAEPQRPAASYDSSYAAPSYEVSAGWATIDDSDTVTGPSPATGTPTSPSRAVSGSGYDYTPPADDVLSGGSGYSYNTGGYQAPTPAPVPAPAWSEQTSAAVPGNNNWPTYSDLYGGAPEPTAVPDTSPATGGRGGHHRAPAEPDYPDYYR
ncbi:hypothetical protein [Streptosporangium sp. KLBMP 9127]|nr:hypothetical protein [Streptosporangium sp. KLBMP 9127]